MEKDYEEELEDVLIEPERMSDELLQSILKSEIDDAIDFIDNTISPIRAESEEYYLGRPFGNEESGRSQAVSMDVRDVVQAILPSLMRIFHGGSNVVEFVPIGPEDVPLAKQATDYCNYVFQNDNDGYSVLLSAFKDALIKKCGIVKFYWDDQSEVETYELENIDDISLTTLTSDPRIEIEILETVQSSDNVDELGNPINSHNVRVIRTIPNGRVRIESVPPEEFLINRNARTLEDADIVAHRRYLTISELVSMGYSEDEVSNYATNETDFDFNQESVARNQDLNSFDDDSSDPSMRRALYVESYIYADMDGDGIAERRRICSIGENYDILLNEPAIHIPFATFMPDPEPHQFFGLSIADITMDVQKIKSMVLRSSLDSLALSTHPRVGVVEGQASMDDVLNTEVGGIIRMRNPGSVIPFSMPYIGKEAFPMLEYLDLVRENRTGVSRAADGLDPSALQSSTKLAVAQTINAAQQRTELIARNFATTGMKQLFKGIFDLIITHQDQERMVRLTNKFVPIDPRIWNSDMDVIVNVALGKGSDEERLAFLQTILQKQEQLLQQLGPENPLVNMQQYYNTLSQIVQLSGFKDVNNFISDPANYQAPPPQPPKTDINEQLIQVQMQQIQADIQKKAAQLELDREKMMRDDDRQRDDDEANWLLKAAELQAKFGAQVDVASIKALADRDREVIKQANLQPVGNINNGRPR